MPALLRPQSGIPMHPVRKFLRLFQLDIQRIRTNPDDTDEYLRAFGTEAVEARRFYNLGAGSFCHPCWTNIDLYPAGEAPSPHIFYDLMSLQPLPLPDGRAELVYCSHTLEHVTDDAVRNALREIYRVLRPGGVVRLVTPDIDLAYRAWRDRDHAYFDWVTRYDSTNAWRAANLRIPLSQASLTQVFLEDFASTASTLAVEGAVKRIDDDELVRLFEDLPYEQALDHCAHRCPAHLQNKYPFHHMNWFNAHKLIGMLKEAGFRSVRRSGHLQSHVAVLRNGLFFDSTLPRVSLYAEAQRDTNR